MNILTTIYLSGVVVGFVQRSYSEDENVGTFRVCVAVTMPLESEPLERMFTLRVSTRPGTAGMSLKLVLLTRLLHHISGNYYVQEQLKGAYFPGKLLYKMSLGLSLGYFLGDGIAESEVFQPIYFCRHICVCSIGRHQLQHIHEWSIVERIGDAD